MTEQQPLGGWELYDRRRKAMMSTFESPNGKEVLDLLKAFCHDRKPTFNADNPHVTSFNEGQRSVIDLILGYLEPTDEQIRALRGTSDD